MPLACCFVNPKLYGKQKCFSEFLGKECISKTPFFRLFPFRFFFRPASVFPCCSGNLGIPAGKAAGGVIREGAGFPYMLPQRTGREALASVTKYFPCRM